MVWHHGIWTKEVKHGGTILFLVTLFDDLSVAIATQSLLSATGIAKNLCYSMGNKKCYFCQRYEMVQATIMENLHLRGKGTPV